MEHCGDLHETRAYVNGIWVTSADARRFEVRSPGTEQVLSQVEDLTASQCREAIDAADVAFQDWKQRSVKERANLLRRWYELILEHEEILARLLTREQGKPVREALVEVRYGASFVEWFAEEARRMYGDVVSTSSGSQRLFTLQQPVGVVSAITPWNFPFAMITRKAAPALAAGCTIVVKPSEETPHCALALARLAEMAGIPPGVFNVLTTARTKEVGLELTTNPKVRKITFTGSTPVGKILTAQAAGSVKAVSMELGGNAPVIVFEDADLELAASMTIATKFRNCGQTCTCANRVLVSDRVYDRFLEIFAGMAKKLTLGNGLTNDVDLGPMINSQAIDKINSLVVDARARGASTYLEGGVRSDLGSTFYAPTILTNVDPDSRMLSEEIFGPVAPVIRFSSDEEAVRLANNTEYGLAAYIFTNHLTRAWKISEALEFGMIGVNEAAIGQEVIPFGGVKQSGLGREGSKYGISEFTEIKSICIGGFGPSL